MDSGRPVELFFGEPLAVKVRKVLELDQELFHLDELGAAVQLLGRLGSSHHLFGRGWGGNRLSLLFGNFRFNSFRFIALRFFVFRFNSFPTSYLKWSIIFVKIVLISTVFFLPKVVTGAGSGFRRKTPQYLL